MISKRLIAVCLLSTALLVGCGSKDTPTDEKKGTSTESTQKFTGTKKGEKLYDVKKGDVIVTEVEFKDGEPVKVSMDVRQEDGSMKKAASEDGKYVMKEGEAKHWHEQIELLETFLNENKVDISKVNLSNDKGNTDAISGVSIKVAPYLDAVKEVINSVKDGKELETGFTGAKAQETEYDPSGKKKDMIQTKVMFEKGKPVNVVIDIKQEDGSSKRKASEEGTYVMKADEAKHWHEQMDLLQKFIVDNNFDLSKVTLTNDEGNTDAVSGVSIKVGNYVKAVQAVLDSAN
ncbi:FMN-binding protein [Clostridium carnis]